MLVTFVKGRAIAQAVIRRLPIAAARVPTQVRSSCAFVVDKVTLGQVFFFEYFSFPCQFSFHRLLHTHLSSGAGTRGQLVADVPSGLSLTPSQETKSINIYFITGPYFCCSTRLFHAL
jgi:hypothetical protein